MKTDSLIEKLNEAVSLEYGAFHMYLHSASWFTAGRLRWHEFFEETARKPRSCQTICNKIVALGGVPTVVDGRSSRRRSDGNAGIRPRTGKARGAALFQAP